ncbi:tripartite tricarboxylate transporter TctB family protein [Alkalihalobacillus oceani]|uniref:tripartite tricarboxylate transporter TctB family protein n=1 Tax=Halalkalibacter oceani TaxID=1653776 RepID=UPI002041D2E9|nr:tripartite tricarboxylate transporter TctB family protein [Halalkalibacter oceani]MCM3759535.1 tripartite tricarboxylate transporter TctB family protein [Halalkalibacter oceani]
MGNLALSIATIIFSIFFFIYTLQIPASSSTSIGPEFWPRVVLISLAIMGIVLLIKSLREMKRPAIVEESISETEKVEEEFEVEEVHKSRYLIIILALFVYILSLSFIGFVPTTPFMLIGIALIIGMRKWYSMALTGVLGTACFIYLFANTLNIPLPRGVGIFRELSYFLY